jgi:hypothetical protein
MLMILFRLILRWKDIFACIFSGEVESQFSPMIVGIVLNVLLCSIPLLGWLVGFSVTLETGERIPELV